MNDQALLVGTSVPRDPTITKPFLRRFHPLWYFAITCTALFVGLSFGALLLGGMAAIIYVLAEDGLLRNNHEYLIPWITFSVVGITWLILIFRLLPRYVRGIVEPTRDALRDGDLFDVSFVDTRYRYSFARSRRLEYKLELERDGARFHIFSPVPCTQVLHRLNTHIAIAFDRAGGAHTARAMPLW